MYKIMVGEGLVPGINLLKIKALAVAPKARAGQFVVLMVDERGVGKRAAASADASLQGVIF